MFCKKCGKKSEGNEKSCFNCGAPLLGNVFEKNNDPTGANKKPNFSLNKNSFNFGAAIKIIIAIIFIGFVIYGNLDEGAVTKNNEGLESYESGDTQSAINQFKQASQDAVTNETKIDTLKNLGYVYDTEGKVDEALSAFKEALNLTKSGTFDYYLISGEIAILENKPDIAIVNYNKAYELNPKDFQINNSLTVFYIDTAEIAPQYENYPKALEYAKKAYEYDTGKSEISKQNLAMAYYFNENFDQAISLLLSTNLNQHPSAAYWLGLAYAGKEDVNNAKLYLQKAVDLGADVPQAILDYLNSN